MKKLSVVLLTALVLFDFSTQATKKKGNSNNQASSQAANHNAQSNPLAGSTTSTTTARPTTPRSPETTPRAIIIVPQDNEQPEENQTPVRPPSPVRNTSPINDLSAAQPAPEDVDGQFSHSVFSGNTNSRSSTPAHSTPRTPIDQQAFEVAPTPEAPGRTDSSVPQAQTTTNNEQEITSAAAPAPETQDQNEKTADVCFYSLENTSGRALLVAAIPTTILAIMEARNYLNAEGPDRLANATQATKNQVKAPFAWTLDKLQDPSKIEKSKGLFVMAASLLGAAEVICYVAGKESFVKQGYTLAHDFIAKAYNNDTNSTPA